MKKDSVRQNPLKAAYLQFSLIYGLDLSEAILADISTFVVDYICCFIAENASRLILSQYDVISVHEDLYRILLFEIEGLAEFLGDNYPSELVELSYDACSLHDFLPLIML
jgi:hypothetical protein